MWATFAHVGLLVLLLCHVSALDDNLTSADVPAAAVVEIGVAAAGSQGSTVPGSARAAGSQQRRYRVNAITSGLAGTLISNEFIVIFAGGVNVRAATTSARARAVSLVQTASTSSSSERVSPAAAELAVTVLSIFESRSSNQSGLAVLRVSGPRLTSRAVRAALSGPQVQAVLQESLVTIATTIGDDDAQERDPLQTSSSSSRRRRALQQQQQQPAAAAAAVGAARWSSSRHRPIQRQPSPSPTSNPSPQPAAAPVNCSGHFTAWAPCGLNHAPMWQACVTYTTYVIDVPAANGGARCPRRTGFKSWKACKPVDCGIGPTPPAGVLPVVPLAPTENAIWGMRRIGIYNLTDRTVVDITKAVESNEGLFAVVIDTGIDSTHPELNVIGFKDMVDDPGATWYNKDGNGHGTHVAGIIGARRNDQGIVGVAPGLPLYGFKVLSSEGRGKKSTVLAAFGEVLALLEQGKKIAVLNLSFVMNNGQAPPDAEEVKTTCGLVKQIAAYGVSIAAAAGNQYGVNVQWILPAACPDVMAVTSMDQWDYASPFSNYALPDANPSVLRSIIAAPGQDIRSTYPTYLPEGPYTMLSGTSQATPFVSGGFVLCLLTGKCKRADVAGEVAAAAVNFPVLQALAKANPCGKFQGGCGPDWSVPGAYYGYMLNVSSLRAAQ